MLVNDRKTSVVMVALALLLVCSIPQATAFSVDAEVGIPGILPVVIVSGSDYEMGYQYGQQAGRYIQKTKEAQWASALKTFNHDEVIRAIKANQHYINEFTPEWLDFMKGMSDGATAAGYAVSYTDVLLINCTLPKPETSTYPEGAENDSLPPKKCSVCSAWGSSTTDGRLIGVNTLDTTDLLNGVVIVAFPDKGNNYMCGADAGEVCDHFLMNNKGLFIGNSGGGGSPRDIDNNYGLAWSCSLPYLARFADSAAEARDMVMKWQINIPENFHFVDVKGGAFVVEKSAAVQSVRSPGDFGEEDFLFSTNNYLNEEMKVTKEGGFIGKHGGYGAYSAPRNLTLWDMLHNYHGQIDVEFAKMLLRFPGNPPPYPPEGGWEAMMFRPTNLWTAVVLPDDGDNGLAHICTGPVGRVMQSSPSSGGGTIRPLYQMVAGTHTFYDLTLPAAPAKMVETAEKTARNELATAYSELMQLNFTDTGFAGLNDLYSEAAAELHKGAEAYNKSFLADGNEALALLAQAATEYTRSQAHARQVYEALVPPPTSPSDLGLKPFGGDWAEWETKVGKKKPKRPTDGSH